ncbi:endonuclease/exonuclease/phosphatase family protein [Vibrio sp. RE86]|uniref:endonuclease/exonuclease/phosphatase family protein n=1 Tax=Vibrio sp. RE86 TaxID=2607605 RepID=UPI001493D336|nr:endonuclease/exonuclease/phosphatase family protein [Vibrio sp. RE86]NOH81718.1 endonuclease/exonuclease/phosphatase family protein [Vibrio sp. RE86]
MDTLKKRSLISLLSLTFSCTAFSQTSFTTWNLEWLSSTPDPKFSASMRDGSDYQALQNYSDKMNSDIIAFQEVNDEKALRRIIGDGYQVIFSDRNTKAYQAQQFSDINQFTGFAVRKGIEVNNQPDIQLDTNPRSKLRFASYVVIHPDSNTPIHVLSVHLKARCSGAYNNSDACKTLKSQGAALNTWIRERERNNQSYVVLGDFNHNMSYRGDWLWERISKNSNALLASQKSKALCKVRSNKNPKRTHQFRSLIDHIVVSDDLAFTIPKQVTYSTDDVLKYQMSDHCPVTSLITTR